jgi:hypothetical protein
VDQSSMGMSGELDIKPVAFGPRGRHPHRVRQVRVPGLGRVMFTRDRGDSTLLGREYFATNLCATHRDGDGKVQHEYDLGSGLVTNVGVLAMANDFAWPTASATIALNTLRVANYHATGTGATAAAATDIKLQTASTQGGQTVVTGTQSLVSAANSQTYRTVATIAYTGTEAVTEWGLFTTLGAIGGTALSSTTGSPFTAGTATTGTVTATPLTASGNGTQGQTLTIVENTGNATPHWGLITSNTTSVVTVPAWYKVSDGTAAGVTPANTNTLVFRPVMWDHKVFSAINVVNGDSIQFTYSLLINSGG